MALSVTGLLGPYAAYIKQFYDLLTGVTTDQNVGIAVSPAYRLDVGGACHASSFPTSSDQRFKDKVQPLSSILDKVRRLRGVSFEWSDHYAKLGRKGQVGTNIGFIAQELEQEFPEVVSKWGEGDPNYEHAAEEYRGVDYGRMVPVLVEAIKELAAQNDTMAVQIASLQKDVATLKVNVPK